MSYNFRDHIKKEPYITTFISQDKKFIYMKPGRTASTGINNLLKESCKKYSQVSLPYFYNRGTDEWLENTPDIFINNFFKFTVVRNPFDRLVSAWRSFSSHTKHKVNNNFEQFIKNRGIIKGKGHWLNEDGRVSNDHWLPLHYYVEFNKDNIFIDYVAKYENLSDDWNFIKQKLNLKIEDNLINTPPQNNSYRKYYTDELIEIVSDFYKRDLELFNYKF